jgi:glutamine synthetase
VKFIRLWFTDILGMLKSFAITVEELEGALEEQQTQNKPREHQQAGEVALHDVVIHGDPSQDWSQRAKSRG